MALPGRARGQVSPRLDRAAYRGIIHETHHCHHQAVQARRGPRRADGHRRTGHDSRRSQRLRSPEGPHGNLSRRRICGELPAQDAARRRRRGRSGREGRAGDYHRRQDRPDRRRKDLRHTARSRGAYPHRRIRLCRALRTDEGTSDDRGRKRANGCNPVLLRVPSSVIRRLSFDIRGGTSMTAITTSPTRFTCASVATLLLLAVTPAFGEPAPAKIDAADTAWMISATGLVLMMTIPGLALFYCGMVRKKNVLATMAQSLLCTFLCSILWAMVGYSLSFTGAEGSFIGTFERLFLRDIRIDTTSPLAKTIPEMLFMIYQMTFAVITVALVAGSVADRMRFSAFVWFAALWLIFVYVPIADWVSGNGGL